MARASKFIMHRLAAPSNRSAVGPASRRGKVDSLSPAHLWPVIRLDERVERAEAVAVTAIDPPSALDRDGRGAPGGRHVVRLVPGGHLRSG